MIYLLPFLAVMGGYFTSFFLKSSSKASLKLLLAFSGSFLLSLTITHLLPEVYEESNGNSGIFIMLGILFQIILEFFSKGAEHGHVHGHEKINRMPWLLFFSLCLHALLEGFPVSLHASLAVGIAVHHFPIAIILSLFFKNAQLDSKAIVLFMLCFAAMTPIGTLIATYFPALKEFQTELTAIVIGILFHISSTIIFESSEGHKFNIAKISMIITGILLAYFL